MRGNVGRRPHPHPLPEGEGVVGVVGLGREGVDLVRFLARHGARVVVSDRAPADDLADAIEALDGIEVDYRLGSQEGGELLHCDRVFVSPGVPRETPVVAQAAAGGIPISSATALFFELCPGHILGITGSSGKTTTTALMGSILRAAGVPSVVGGNIGVPMMGRLEEITPQTWCVLELSSFQLEDLERSPTVAVVLNISPNHLDRHHDMSDYVRAKRNILNHQGPQDVAVLNGDDPIVAALPHASRTVEFALAHRVKEGAWLEGDQLWLSGSNRPLLRRAELRLRGLHNVANCLAAAAAATVVGCDPQRIAAAVRSFEPVPHRLEVVDVIDGITFVNDSIATTPERSIAALRSIDQPVVLIAGGRDKHLPMEEWARVIGERARGVVLMGEASPLIRAALEQAQAQMPVEESAELGEAVRLARLLAQRGDAVLLSPGCTSFDQFRDYAARGDAFRTEVAALARGESGGD